MSLQATFASHFRQDMGRGVTGTSRHPYTICAELVNLAYDYLRDYGTEAAGEIHGAAKDWWYTHYKLPDNEQREAVDGLYRHLGISIDHAIQIEVIRLRRRVPECLPQQQ